MIDRASRDRLALALRQFISGRIHNDQLADTDVDWRDRGAVVVAQRAWSLYDDMEQHFAVGNHAFDRPARREIACWILFLHSDKEYLWPEYAMDRVRWPLMNFITFGWYGCTEDRRWDEFCETGDFSVWPFQNESELQTVLNNPKYFKGK